MSLHMYMYMYMYMFARGVSSDYRQIIKPGFAESTLGAAAPALDRIGAFATSAQQGERGRG